MCNCSETDDRSINPLTSRAVTTVSGSAVPPGVPLATAIGVGQSTPAGDPGSSAATAVVVPLPPQPIPIPPHFVPCHLDLRDGCYVIAFKPTGLSLVSYEGTVRVDRKTPGGGADNIMVSGDLYTKPIVIGPTPLTPHISTSDSADVATSVGAGRGTSSVAGAASTLEAVIPIPLLKPVIPIFARSRYHSYLKITSVSVPAIALSTVGCHVTLVAEQYFYTQPPAGQFKGTFPAAPSRTVTIVLSPAAAPAPYSSTGGPYYEGRLLEAGVDKGAITLAWVSSFFRRASVELDVLKGSVAPAPVPDGGGGTEFFDTIFAKTGWQLSVVKDQTNVPVPAGVTATNCWSNGDLHNLMASIHQPVSLDAEWRIHLSVVPAKLGCGRGVMFDVIGVPREGCSSFSDDGYPTSDSSNFGVAANKKQRDIARAFLRSATHEITHTFNQIHQEQETAADNSIMTTTPSVADVLGGPATGAPGVFPDQINLAHNTTVRHHLNHMPDPVIRPGGWPFASWFPTGAPQAGDRYLFDGSELALAVIGGSDTLALGQPLDVSWTMTNHSGVPLVVPNDVTIEALFASVTVTDGEGRERAMRPFVIRCDRSKLAPLEPGGSVSASTKVFWASSGFAFERPGRYRVSVSINWSAQGLPVRVEGGVDVFVDYPASDEENRAAGLVLHPEVGKYVALGGGAYHLAEACRRLYELSENRMTARDTGTGSRVLQSLAELLPDRSRLAALYPGIAGNVVSTPRKATSAAKKPLRSSSRAKGRRR